MTNLAEAMNKMISWTKTLCAAWIAVAAIGAGQAQAETQEECMNDATINVAGEATSTHQYATMIKDNIDGFVGQMVFCFFEYEKDLGPMEVALTPMMLMSLTMDMTQAFLKEPDVEFGKKLKDMPNDELENKMKEAFQ